MGYKFTDLEKHYILSRAWHEYHPSIMKAMDESATGQVWNSAVAGWTEDQRAGLKGILKSLKHLKAWF